MSFEVCFLTKKITIDKMQLLMTGQGQLIKIISNQNCSKLIQDNINLFSSPVKRFYNLNINHGRTV